MRHFEMSVAGSRWRLVSEAGVLRALGREVHADLCAGGTYTNEFGHSFRAIKEAAPAPAKPLDAGPYTFDAPAPVTRRARR